jgi:hypothetical protein
LSHLESMAQKIPHMLSTSFLQAVKLELEFLALIPIEKILMSSRGA